VDKHRAKSDFSCIRSLCFALLGDLLFPVAPARPGEKV